MLGVGVVCGLAGDHGTRERKLCCLHSDTPALQAHHAGPTRPLLTSFWVNHISFDFQATSRAATIYQAIKAEAADILQLDKEKATHQDFKCEIVDFNFDLTSFPPLLSETFL